MLAELRRGLVVRLRDPAVRLGLVGGVGLSLVILAGYVLLPAPTSTGSGPLRRSVEAGVLFFDRPMWHHALVLVVPSFVGGAVLAWIVRSRVEGTDRSDDVRVLALQWVCLPAAVTAFAMLTPLALGISSGSAATLALGLLFAGVYLSFVLPVLMLLSLGGIALGYLLVELVGRFGA